MHMKHKNRM